MKLDFETYRAKYQIIWKIAHLGISCPDNETIRALAQIMRIFGHLADGI